MTTTSFIWCLVLVVAVMVLGYVHLYLSYRRNISKVAFMFDAIYASDFTFSFSTQGVSGSDAMLNKSLNRIKQILVNARDEAVEREKYYEQIMDAAGTGLLVVDEAGHILQHNVAAARLLHRSVLTHMEQVGQQFADGSLSVRETYTTLRNKRVRIVAFSDINGELANREVDSWIKLIRVLTHEIMNTITPITSLSQSLLQQAKGEQREGLEVINKTGTELMAFVENYRRFTHVPQPQPRLFYAKPFLERMATLADADGRVGVSVKPADLLVYAETERASARPVGAALADSLLTGLGFALALVVTAALRVLLASGVIAGAAIPLAKSAPGGFFVFAIVMAIVQAIFKNRTDAIGGVAADAAAVCAEKEA